MRVGIHCSVRHGLIAALEEAASLSCETLQIFSRHPRGWKTKTVSDEEFAAFRRRRRELKIDPLVAHSPYLPNLCSADPAVYKKSINWLMEDLSRCESLGADFLVIHPGAYSPESSSEAGLANLVSALNAAFKRRPGKTVVLIENMAGGGRRLGDDFNDLEQIFAGVVEKNRMGICFDLCHATGAGYELNSPERVRATLAEFDQTVGLEKIRVFHVNDSKGALGSHRDMHEHLGRGVVGLGGLPALFSQPQFADCALILETPKFPAPASDRENLRILKSLLPDGSGVKIGAVVDI